MTADILTINIFSAIDQPEQRKIEGTQKRKDTHSRPENFLTVNHSCDSISKNIWVFSSSRYELSLV